MKEIEEDKKNNVLVVSGAIALGMILEKEKRKKEELKSVELQGYASFGQLYLMDLYKRLFRKKIVAQLLVTEKEIIMPGCIERLVRENANKNRVTLINYNDGVDFEEVKKDNDTLAAEIMLSCDADRLIILGNDYDGFRDNESNLIERVKSVDENIYAYCNGKSKYGSGGFKTKLDAAKKILEADKEMIISNIQYNLEDIIRGLARRTLFKK